MSTIEYIKIEIEKIKQRNAKVEADKAWELSWTRKLLVSGLTYLVVVMVFIVSDMPEPFLNALVPTVAFLISTLTVSFVKKLWLKTSPRGEVEKIE